MKYTSNYNLKLPEGSDFYNVEDFNSNATAIDTAVKANADGISTNTSAISAETERAKGVEQNNANAIATETTRAKEAETTNANAIAAINKELEGVADALAAI